MQNRLILLLATGFFAMSVFSNPALLKKVGNDRMVASVASFAQKASYVTGTSPESVAIGDLNGDGKADLVTADSYQDDTISVFVNNGNGTYAQRVTYPTIDPKFGIGSTPLKVAIADLNGDGKADVVSLDYGPGYVSVFINKGDGTLSPAVIYTAGSSATVNSIAVGDINGDCKPDLVISNYASNQILVMMNNGNGTFADAVRYDTGNGPTGIALGDVNGDGKLDVVTGDNLSGQMSVLLNNGNGTFAARVGYADVGSSAVAIGDVNGDGKADIVTTDYTTKQMSVFINTGTGTFAPRVSYATGLGPTAVAIGDLDGDGKADIATADNSSNQTSVFINNGDGTFAPAIAYATGNGTDGVAIGDLSGDGRADIVTSDHSGNDLTVYINSGTFIPPTITTPAGPVCKKPMTIKATGTVSIQDNQKSGICGLDKKGKPIASCKIAGKNISVKAFDANSSAFKTAYGTNPARNKLPTIFNGAIAASGSCTTDSAGTCSISENNPSTFLVIAEVIDGSVTSFLSQKAILTASSTSVNSIFNFQKTIEKNGTIKYN